MNKASTQLALSVIGGARRDRTVDLLDAMQALSQLSYSPVKQITLEQGANFSDRDLQFRLGGFCKSEVASPRGLEPLLPP